MQSPIQREHSRSRGQATAAVTCHSKTEAQVTDSLVMAELNSVLQALPEALLYLLV